jgi:cell division septum initiation protein DivIVA
MTISINATLDRVESNLPLIPRRVLRLQRSVAEAGLSVAKTILRAISRSSDRVEQTARTGVNTVTGQARAQANATVDVAESESASLLGRATRSVEGEATERLEEWSKADLYERAQQLDIDGRSTMSKKQLVSALRSA